MNFIINKEKNLQNIVKEFIEKKLEKSIVLEKPKDSSLGHFATPVAFFFGKRAKKVSYDFSR